MPNSRRAVVEEFDMASVGDEGTVFVIEGRGDVATALCFGQVGCRVRYLISNRTE
jgi:hypothetical protein